MKSIYMYGRNYLRERVHVSLLHLPPPPPPPLLGFYSCKKKFGTCFKSYFIITFFSLLGKLLMFSNFKFIMHF